MGATGTPTLTGGAPAPVRGFGKGQVFLVPITFTMSASYATGGDPLTLPVNDVRGMELKQVNVSDPFPAPGTDRMFSWNGSASAPKIGAKVISTGAEVANATDLSATTLHAILVYEA